MTSCPICNYVNVAGAARCEKCDTWLAQAADVGLKPQVRTEASRMNLNGATSGLTPEFADELQQLLREGQSLTAIKRFREVTGLGLRESKEAIEALMAGRGLPAAAGDASVDEAKIVALLRENQFLQAIKEYRTATGLGLKDAKEAVEAIAARHGVRPTQKGCLGMILLVIALPMCGLFISVLW
jgi:ribosomal protein L7/L12